MTIHEIDLVNKVVTDVSSAAIEGYDDPKIKMAVQIGILGMVAQVAKELSAIRELLDRD